MAVLAEPVTRVPLWSGKPDNIIGILHAKDLLRAIRDADGNLSKVDVKAIEGACLGGRCSVALRLDKAPAGVDLAGSMRLTEAKLEATAGNTGLGLSIARQIVEAAIH